MDAANESTDADPLTESRIMSSFPPLDPNGQPFSMVLRGDAAELGELRAALASHPNARQDLEAEVQKTNAAVEVDDDGENYQFGDDADMEGMDQMGSGQSQSYGSNDVHHGEPGLDTQQQQQVEVETTAMDDENANEAENKKRRRDGDGDDDGIEDECDEEYTTANQEQLLFYLPSIQCTCSSWKMKDVPGELFVTTLRVFFLPSAGSQSGDEGSHPDDLAIDGSCIALHAVDSLPGENEAAGISHHVYCQLAEPTREEGGMGYTSSMSMFAPANIAGENDDDVNTDAGEQEEQVKEGEEDEGSEENGTIEVYFKPVISDEGERNDDGNQSDRCQSIFNALTKLASLNPAGDAGDGFNGGGGLFSMLSMMAGINNAGYGFDGEMMFAGQDDGDDEDMVVRFGGSNNFVENDDESEGAPDEERDAMLRRLDDMLVVPPEYEIASSEDGQFDDAEDDDDADDDIL